MRFADDLWVLASGQVAAHGAPEPVLTPECVATVFGVEAQRRVCRDGRAILVPPKALERRQR